MGISSRAIVANIRGIRTLPVIHAVHKLRHDGVHVRISLAVRMRRQVQRHVVEENGEICAVIEIEPAKKILVSFAPAGVLSDDDAGNRLQYFSRAKNRTLLDFSCAHCSLRCGLGISNKVILPALHVDAGAQRSHH